MYKKIFLGIFSLFLCMTASSCKSDVQQAEESISGEIHENVTQTTANLQELTKEESETTEFQEPATEESIETNTQSSQRIMSMDISQINFEAFEKVMDDNMWNDFKRFIPVLKNEAEFTLSMKAAPGTVEGLSGTTYLNGFFSLMDDYFEDTIKIYDFTVLDLDSDGNSELIICFNNMGGHYLILHEENGKFFAADTVYRGFLQLQKNGIYMGSGGAACAHYFQLTFKDGMFIEHEIASSDTDYETDYQEYIIGGKQTDSDTFHLWITENISDPAMWYEPFDNGEWKYVAH